MSKLILSEVPNGVSNTVTNTNFDRIEKELNDNTLKRRTEEGEDNALHTSLDMNSNRIYNLPEPVLEHEPARKKDISMVEGYAAESAASAAQAKQSAIEAAASADSVQIKEQEREQIFENAQEERENRFNDFIASSGYQFLGDYASGIEITEYNQIVRDADGEFWRLSGKVELPYTTTGAGLPEDDSLAPLGDAVLRQQLSDEAQGAAMIGRGVVAVDSIADLLALPSGQRKEGLRYLVKGYHAGSVVGGGEFYWSSTDATAHDGVLVFSVNGMANGRFIRLTKGTVSPSDAGCVVGETDNFDALNRLFHAAINKGLTVRPDTLGEAYEFSGALRFDYPGKRLYVDGRGLKLKSSDGHFEVRGSIDLLGPILSNPASTGEYSIQVDSTDGIQVGDLLSLHNPTDYSFSSHRPQYRSGEFVRVADIDENILTFNSALHDNYPSGITNIYKINTADFKAMDFHVDAEGNHSSMRLSFLSDFKLINCSARGGYQRGLMVDRCSVGYVLRGSYICDAPFGAGSEPGSGAALQYGINYYCCEDIEVRGAYCFGTRHPIASGGETPESNIVTRRCNAYDCILESSSVFVHGPDFHGNTEDCHYYNCHSNHAVGLAGKNISWIGGTIGSLPGSTRRPMGWHELVGGVIKYAGVRKAVVPFGSLAFGQINSVIEENIDHNYSIIIDDIDLVFSGHTGSNLGTLACRNTKETLTSWDVSLTRIRHTGRTGPFTALFATSDFENNKPFSRLIVRDIQGWEDITGSVATPASYSFPSDTKMDLPSLFVDTEIVLSPGEWGISIGVPIRTQLRIPKIRLYFAPQNSRTESGEYVWVTCHLGNVTRTSVTVRATTGSSGLKVDREVSIPVTIEIIP